MVLGIDTGKKNIGYGIVNEGNLVECGLWVFHKIPLFYLWQNVLQLFRKYPIKLIAFERILSLRNFRTGSHLLEQAGVLKLIALLHKIDSLEVSPRSIYKFLKAKTKKDIKQYIEQRYNIKVSQHTADAVAIALYAERRYKNAKTKEGS